MSCLVINPEPTVIATNVRPTSPAAAPPAKKQKVSHLWRVWDNVSGVVAHQLGNWIRVPARANTPDARSSIELSRAAKTVPQNGWGGGGSGRLRRQRRSSEPTRTS
jgi:hypothetical protein